MYFNSYIFILLFLPLTILGYYTLNRFHKGRLGQLFLTLMSLVFYAYYNKVYLFIMIGSIVVNYGFYKAIVTWQQKDKNTHSKLILALGVLSNIGLLFYFKYFDFFLDNVNSVFHMNFHMRNILLPLGISFFTFQQIGFLVDVYRGEVGEAFPEKAQISFSEYALFVSFFPHIVAGPIVSFRETMAQFRDEARRKVSLESMQQGIMAFSYGLAKKVLVADTFGRAVDWGFTNLDSLNTTGIILILFSYALQVYFDFSGYSDMAIGVARLFHIDLPLNFNSPLKSETVIELWKRWHITLNRFLTRYIYIPLGGSRKGVIRANINIMVIFLVSGIWHGSLWTYVMWGAVHGVCYIITKKGMPVIKHIPYVINCIITNIIFTFSLIYFRSTSMSQAHLILWKLLPVNWDFGKISLELAKCYNMDELFYLLKVVGINKEATIYYVSMYIILILVWGIVLFTKNVNERIHATKIPLRSAVFCAILLVWSMVSFSQVTSFLYVNF